MYVTKAGAVQKIQEDTFLYWQSLGWSLDQNQDGVADSTVGGGAVTKAAVIGTGLAPADIGAATTAAVATRPVYRHGAPADGDYPVGTFVVDVDDADQLYEITA